MIAYGKLGAQVLHELLSGKTQAIAFPDIDKQISSHTAS